MKKNNQTLIFNTNGFTLIEVLIAITIMAFMMLGIISFTESTYETSDRVIREDKEMLQVETAMARLEWDISQIYSPLYFSHAMNPEKMSESEGEAYNQLIGAYQSNSRFSTLSYDGLPIPVYRNPDKSTLVIFTNSNRRKFENSKQSQFAWVKYSLEKDDRSLEDAKTLNTAKEPQKANMLIRQFYVNDIFNPDEIDWEDVKSQVLLRKVINILFEFWNPANQKWTDNLDTIKDGRQLIRAIRITVDYYDHDNIEKKSVRIYRPLYPEFNPEDMYKFLNAKINNQNNGSESDTTDNTNSTTTENNTTEND